MRTPFLRESSPDEQPSAPGRGAAFRALLPVVLCFVAAVGFVLMAVFVQSIVAASMFTTAAIVFLGIGLILGLSMWVFPDLPR
jgi:drug/metabolite transporter (DMT)-like permease